MHDYCMYGVTEIPVSNVFIYTEVIPDESWDLLQSAKWPPYTEKKWRGKFYPSMIPALAYKFSWNHAWFQQGTHREGEQNGITGTHGIQQNNSEHHSIL